MSEITRFQVEIDVAEMSELEELQAKGGLRTKRELLNTAMTLLKWAAREKARGCIIVSVNERNGQMKELEMPFLEAVAGRPEADPDLSSNPIIRIDVPAKQTSNRRK